MSNLAILVTGSRELERTPVFEVLSARDPRMVIHGDAHGADYWAGRWAKRSAGACSEVAMPAQWDLLGRGAGPMRNNRMIEVCKALEACGWKIEVHAFPIRTSIGTRDCIKKARAAELHVFVH